jgi:hypothetical protein
MMYMLPSRRYSRRFGKHLCIVFHLFERSIVHLLLHRDACIRRTQCKQLQVTCSL